MAISFSASLLLVALITTVCLRLTSASDAPFPSQPLSLPVTPPPSSPSPSPSPSTAPPPGIQEKQLRNILDALVGAGDFGGWTSLLSSANPSALPLTATLFIPSNAAITRLLSSTGAQFDPHIIPYHIVPQRLTFSDLQRLPTHTRLPTLLPSKFIVITSNSSSNFTLDGSRIMQADAFLNAAFALHSIDKILDYTAYGDGSGRISPAPAQDRDGLFGRKKRPAAPGNVSSGARRSCTGITVMILSSFLWWQFLSRFLVI